MTRSGWPVADDLSAALAEIRERAASALDPEAMNLVRTYRAVESAGDVPRLLAALDAVLALHAPRTDVLYGRSCITHRPLKPVPDCVLCTQDQSRQVCPECRDEFSDPVPFQDCRARSAALAALTGGGSNGG